MSAEDRIAESVARDRAVLDSLAEGVVVHDVTARIVSSNRAAQEILGLSVDELTGLTAVDPRWHAIHEDGSPFPGDEHPAIVTLSTGATVTDVLMGVRHSSGETRWLVVNSWPLHDASGDHVTGAVASFRDVTQQRRADEAVRGGLVKLEAALASMTDAVFISDASGNFVDVNEAFATFHRFGSRAEALMTLAEYPDILDVLTVDGRPAPLENWAVPRALRGEVVTEAEYTLRRKDTGESWIGSYNFAPIRAEDGEIVGSVVVARDITERKRAERQLAQMARLYATLSQVNQAIVRAKEPAELYQSICDVAVKFGEFTLAWVGLLDEGSGDVRPVAGNGADVANWPFEMVSTHKGVSKNGLVATAIRSRKIAITGDIEFDEKMRSVLGQIEGRDYHAIAAIPFGPRGETFGVLVLVSRRAGLFKEASEIGLLEEMGLDISFALETMATEAERERAEEALSESEQQYRGLFESSPVPVSLNEVICDAQGQPCDYRFLYVNPALEQFMGMTAAKLAGHTILEVAPLVDRAMVDRCCRVALTGVPDYFEGHSAGLNKDHATTVYSPRCGQFVTFIVDITERKRAEEQIAADAARLKLLANVSRAFGEAGPDYQAVVDRVVREIAEVLADNSQIRLLSDDAERMELVGSYARDPEISRALRDMSAQIAVRTDDPGPVGRALNGDATLVSAVDPKELLASYPPELRPVLERFMPRSFILVPLRVDARAIGALSLTRYRDEQPPFTEDDLNLAQDLADRAALAISKARLMTQVQHELVERRKAEAEVRALNESLERRVQDRTAALEVVNRELEAFSYSVSHDLRAPLRHMDGFSKILLDKYADQLDPEARRLLGIVVGSAQEMGVLIDDLLRFSRVARKDFERQPVDMDRLVRSVCVELRSAHPGRVIEFDVGTLCWVPGDQALLRQVWANLLGNAVKFTGQAETPRIEVRCERATGARRYTVRDNGAGFDATYADKLFQPFQRLHKASEFEGSGIGLAIVARIVQRHGGQVWAEGAPGAGATFGFSLPEGEEEQ